MMRYLFIILLFPLVAFADCVGCPKGTTLQGGLGMPQATFTGYTSAVDSFDGASPDCFLPQGTTLNGVIAGINSALCGIKNSLNNINVSYDSQSYLNQIDSIYNEINKIYTAILVNTDGTIDLSSVDSNNTKYWNLVLNIDSVITLLNANVNYKCLIDTSLCDTASMSEFQKLIDNVALLYAPQVDTCMAWDFYCNVTTQQFDSFVLVTIEPLSDTITGTPANMCLDVIQYIFQILDANGNVIINSLINVPSELGQTTTIGLPAGYATGADTLNVIARFTKYQCQSNVQCGYYDYTESISITGP